MKHPSSSYLKLLIVAALPCVLAVTVYRVRMKAMLTQELKASVRRQDYQAVLTLIHQGADINTFAPAGNASTPLLMAVCHDDAANVLWMLDVGADPNFPHRAATNTSALMLAAQALNVEEARQLIAHGADVNFSDIHGTTVLDMVDTDNADARRKIMIGLLLKSGASKLPS